MLGSALGCEGVISGLDGPRKLRRGKARYFGFIKEDLVASPDRATNPRDPTISLLGQALAARVYRSIAAPPGA
jgi:hypothetical protein